MKPLRILHVLGIMNRGGAETMVMNLYRNIDRTKIQFDFIVHTKEKGHYDDEIKRLGGKIYHIPKFLGINYLQYISAWKRFLRNNKTSKIIHSHISSTASIFLPIASKYGLITIIHSHNTSTGSGFKAIIKNYLQRKLKNNISDYYFACSYNAAKWLFGMERLGKNNFQILKNSINSKQYIYNLNVRKRVREELNLNDKFIIGHVGRFQTQKNHDFIIDIFSEIYKRNNKTILLLIGTGELEQKIKRKIAKLGLSDAVRFLGVRSDVHELLQAMDVFLFPSLYEGLGMVAIEAQAAGLQVIASDEVPEEAKITDLVEFISLDRPASYWAEQVLKYSNGYERQNTYNEICKSGYDIKENAKWLESFYLDIEVK